MSAARPLEGKRIVVTRAIEQARAIKDRLENMGAVVLLLPLISFSEPADMTEVDHAIRALKTFDWILFTSANAVRFFAARCRKLGVAFAGSEKPLCAAVGPATASAANSEGFAIEYVANEFRGIALVRELGASLAGKRALLPRSEQASRDLPDALAAAGAEVTEVVTYLTRVVGAAPPGVKEAVRDARVDVVSFFSPSAVENFRQEFGAEMVSRLAAKVALAAVGPVTAAALRNAGLAVAIEASDATAESMAAAIQKYFSTQAASQAGSVRI